MRNNTKKTVLLATLITAVVLTAVCVFYYIWKQMDTGSRKKDAKTAEENTETISQEDSSSIYFEGKEYVYNKNLNNILFMGVDKNAEATVSNMVGTSGQADCLMILSMNKEDQTVRVLQVSRDTMTDVDLFDVSGNYYTTVKAQIATQYAYGNGVQSSCFATKKTVSELLYDLPIDGYLSLNLAGISLLTDAVGGVTLTIPEDYTDIDPAFVKGDTVTLNGELAEKYVRKRDITVTGSNEGRMRRQMQFIPAMLQAVRQKVGAAGNYYKLFSSVLDPYMATDLSAEQINQIGSYQFLENETEYLPGEMRAGEEHDEFYVDEEKLQELIVKMFYIEK